jgi:hypothetical protein
MEGIIVLARESYNKEWAKYFDGEKNEHYKQDSCYMFCKGLHLKNVDVIDNISRVATFWRSNRYIFRTLLFVVSVIEKGVVNWAKWFKMKIHKEMIVV